MGDPVGREGESAAGACAGMHRLLAVTGRFQPLHREHLWLIERALSLAERVLIGITNPDRRSLTALPASGRRHLPDANPFSYLERARMIRAALAALQIPAERFELVPFPIEAAAACASYVPPGTPQLVRVYSAWEREKAELLRRGGYPVIVIEPDAPKALCASEIRAAMAAGDRWEHAVPAGARQALLAIGAEELRRRCSGRAEAVLPC